MRIIPSGPGPDSHGNCCNKPRRGQLCAHCPHQIVRNSDPDTSEDAAKYMSAGNMVSKKRIEMNKALLVYYKTGKEMNPWEMLGQSEGTIGPDSCYWHRCGDLRKVGELELVLDRLGHVVKRPGPSTRNQRVYRITELGESVAKDLILDT